MPKYIESEALIKSKEWGCLKSVFDVVRARIIIMSQPAADVVEVVRCKNCYHYSENKGICTNTACVKSFYGCKVKEDDYCSHGERKCDNG